MPGEVTWLPSESITKHKNIGKDVFFNTWQGTMLTHIQGMNYGYFGTKGVPFDVLKCDAKQWHLSQLVTWYRKMEYWEVIF